jgi:putative spermidine/putrescine transport system permease protein
MNARLAGPGAWVLYAICLGTGVFVLAPLCVVVAMSFSDSYFVQFPPQGFTLRWYAKILQERDFLEGLRLSCLLSLSATLIALALGVPTAFALTRGRFIGQGLLKTLVLTPLIFPTLVTGLSLMQLFARLGWGDARINLLIGHAVVTVPYVIRAVTTSLLLVDRNLEDAARTLGANRVRTFRRVILPQISAGVAAGGLFAFMVSFDNYPVTMWLADSVYSPVPMVLMRQLTEVFDPSVPAMSTVVILLAVVGVLALERLVGLRRAVVM